MNEHPPIIDTHQHLIYLERLPYSWTSGIPALSGRVFRYDDYLREIDGTGISGTLFMETSPDYPAWEDETRFFLDLAGQPGSLIRGVIANCRPEQDESAFSAYLDSVLHPKLVGFRRILHVEPDELSQSNTFTRNLRQIGRHQLTFDLCVLARQLPLAVKLIRACPDLQFILDHCGVPDIAGGQFNPWWQAIRGVADLPNVACKISGVLAYCAPGQATAEAVGPYVEHCIECFGWDRVVWGSDWPVVNITASLNTWVQITRQLIAGADPADQRKLLHDNALRIYCVPE